MGLNVLQEIISSKFLFGFFLSELLGVNIYVDDDDALYEETSEVLMWTKVWFDGFIKIEGLNHNILYRE